MPDFPVSFPKAKAANSTPVLPDARGIFANPFGKLPSPFPSVHPDAPRSRASEYDEIATGTVTGIAEDVKNIANPVKNLDTRTIVTYSVAAVLAVFGLLMVSRGPAVTVERLKGK